MITRWRLFNFKSVRNDTVVPLAPLTVLAGANSSGKSTLLQSMLMVAQTLDSRVASRPVVLNGPLVRMGTLQDVRSYGSESESLLVGFEAVTRFRPGATVTCDVTFDGTGGSSEIARLHPSLLSSEVELRLRDRNGPETKHQITVRRSATSASERARELDLDDLDDALVGQLGYEIDVKSQILGQSTHDLLGGSLRHFLAESGVRRAEGEDGGLEPVSLPHIVQDIGPIISFIFGRLRYLGPLRDEPRALYPLSTTADTTDVGLRGEHTAAVFDLHRQSLVSYVSASNFPAPSPGAAQIAPEVRHRTLEAAVVEWLQYLGVVDSLTTRDLGNLGHELKVTTAGVSKPHDITHVGTGVSQVLPIVVMCLLAPPDTTLLIEQPELHLHPRVQTLLGDFFLAAAMAGRQVIVETHSEYLVNRLRYRIAAAEGDRVASLVTTYFVEKDAAGASVFRPVGVNRYGAIAEWPKGFFDQSQREIEQILLAGAMKKKAERSGGRDGQSGP